MWISTLLFWGFVTWLVVSPDKVSLAASRGLWGAARGWANPKYASKSSKKAGRPGAAQGSRWAGLLGGWQEGIRVARQKRSNGKDVWSRGSYVAGRVWGGTSNVRAGVRRIPAQMAAWRAERAAKKGAPTVQGFVVDEQPTTDPNSESTDAPADGPGYGPQPYTGPDNGFRHHFADPSGNNRAYCGVNHPAPPLTTLVSLTDHAVCDACCSPCRARATAEPTTPGPEVVQGEVVAVETPKDLAAEPAEGAPAEGAGAPSNTTTTPALAGERMNTMSDMSIGELDNLGAMKAEGVDSAGALIAMLGESMAAAKVWGPNFQERWSGTNWGTERIDNAVAMIAEGADALGSTELMQSGVAELQAAIEEAQGLAEMAAEVKATGDVSSFAEA
ncbi:MAG: hypothetical protein ACRDS9_09120 [Pseudonocardiaceae bacterium]